VRLWQSIQSPMKKLIVWCALVFSRKPAQITEKMNRKEQPQ